MSSVDDKNNLELKDVMILFDRDQGVSIFPNFRGYDDPIDDAEWLLERNPSSKGFILRPIVRDDKCGLWIGEFTHSTSGITRYEEIYDEGASKICNLILKYASEEISERSLIERLTINSLKKTVKSNIIQDFKYYVCPINLFYSECKEVNRIYEHLKSRFGVGRRISYSTIADEILKMNKCQNAIICPLKASNAFERIYNLNKALRSRGIGEIRIIDPATVMII